MTQSSSVVFSLKELARMEEERVRANAEASQRERELRERARREAEARALAEEQAREEAQAAARREVERQAREEAARIEAIHRAAIEAARAAEEAKARAAAAEAERRHELELERVRASARGGGGRGTAVAALFGAVVATGIALALHLGVVVPRQHAREASQNAEIASRDAALGDLRAQADAADRRTRALEADMASLRGDNDRLRAELAAATQAGTPPRHGPGTFSPRHPKELTPDGFTSCPPGSKDPLCVH